MSVQKPPDETFQFGGMVVSDGPLWAPYGSAEYILDFRVMRENWLRLRGGHAARYNTTSGQQVLVIHRTKTSGAYSGSNTHLVSIKYGSSDVRMLALGVSPFSLSEGSPLETINVANVVKLATEPTPMADASRYIVFANGYGYNVEAFGAPSLALNSVPYLSSYSVNDGHVRFWGLMAKLDVASLSSPSLVFTSGSGTGYDNSVTTAVKIYMGLYNSTTGHYSDGYYVGTRGPTSGTGKLEINSPQTILAPWHDLNEKGELKYVFYATVDGYQVPYLILNAAGDGPLTHAYASSSAVDLSVNSGTTNGWVLDLTHRMPVNNAPPRPMDCIWYAGGRMYGIVASAVVNTDTTFKISDFDRNGIVFSEASGATQTQDFLGDPLQSWPAKNFSRTPDGEVPVYGCPAPDKTTSLVWTSSAVFTVREQSDGILLDWDTANPEHGLFRPTGGPARCVVQTQRGTVWLTQRKQLAIYTTDGEVKILTDDVDGITSRGIGDDVKCLSYVFDPINGIEAIDIYSTFTYDPSGSTINAVVRYDFRVGFSIMTDPYIVSAAERITDASGRTYHLIAGTYVNSKGSANAAFYSKEGQPDASYQIRTRDQQFAGTSGQTQATATEIGTATWRSNWIGFNDPNWRKQIDFVDLIGDGETSAQLSGTPLAFSYVQGFRAASGARTTTLVKRQQETLEQQYRATIDRPYNTWWKFIVTLTSHAAEYGDYYPSPALEGDLSSNFYGCVMMLMPTIGMTQVRKG